MNPFLKHPILQFVGYEMMKRPTLEGIKTSLKKESEKGKWSRIILLIPIIYVAIREFNDGNIIFGILLLLFVLFVFIMLSREKYNKLKRFEISGEEISEQIEIRKKWSDAKSV